MQKNVYFDSKLMYIYLFLRTMIQNIEAYAGAAPGYFHREGGAGASQQCVNPDCRICKGAEFTKIEGEGVTPSKSHQF